MENILENVNKEITDGYVELEENKEVVIACDKWLMAWELLKKANKKKVASIEAFEISCGYKFYEKLELWVQDIEMELENAAEDNEEYYNKRAIFCREFCDEFPKSDKFIMMCMELAQAESMFELGNIEDSDKLFDKVASKYEGTVWPYVKWGDCYWVSNILHKDNSLIDLDKAENIYRRGLEIVDKNDKHILEKRFEEVVSINSRMKNK